MLWKKKDLLGPKVVSIPYVKKGLLAEKVVSMLGQ